LGLCNARPFSHSKPKRIVSRFEEAVRVGISLICSIAAKLHKTSVYGRVKVRNCVLAVLKSRLKPRRYKKLPPPVASFHSLASAIALFTFSELRLIFAVRLDFPPFTRQFFHQHVIGSRVVITRSQEEESLGRIEEIGCI
jgi:hypothetical protein